MQAGVDTKAADSKVTDYKAANSKAVNSKAADSYQPAVLLFVLPENEHSPTELECAQVGIKAGGCQQE